MAEEINGEPEPVVVLGWQAVGQRQWDAGSSCSSLPEPGMELELEPEQLPASCTQIQDSGIFPHLKWGGDLVLDLNKYGCFVMCSAFPSPLFVIKL